MDNNFNMQQNNMQQPVYQQMPQGQPMYPPMPPTSVGSKKPKSKKGLIIGLIVGGVLLITGIVIALLAIFVWGKDADLEGTWVAKDGTKVKFEKVIENDGDQDGYIYYSIYVDGDLEVSSCLMHDKKIVIKRSIEMWSDSAQAYVYDVEELEIKVVKVTNSKLVLKYKGDTYEFKRK